MGDEVIECLKCGRSFTWSSGEQRYFRERGLERPKRCPACREHMRATTLWHARYDDRTVWPDGFTPPADAAGEQTP